MSNFVSLFNVILYQPLFNVLVLLYVYLPGHDFGIAVILLTLLVRFIFYPLGVNAVKSQKALMRLQPLIKEVQEKYKNDKEQQTKEVLALYKREKVNPFSGIFSILVQLPVLIAVYKVFWNGFHADQLSLVYTFVPRPEVINTMFLGFMDLAQPSVVLAVIAGILQFVQMKTSMSKMVTKSKKKDFSSMLQKQMIYFMPFFTLIILFKLPAAIGIYWITTTVFTIAQQYAIK